MRVGKIVAFCWYFEDFHDMFAFCGRSVKGAPISPCMVNVAVVSQLRSWGALLKLPIFAPFELTNIPSLLFCDGILLLCRAAMYKM